MTLVELLVVITILGIVAMIALGGAGELDSRFRFEETARRGETIRAAARRFAMDTGRWPQVRGALTTTGGVTTESTTATDASGYLAELYRRECIPDSVRYGAVTLTLDFDTLVAAGETAACPGLGTPATPSAYTSPALHCGWRGPYLDTAHSGLYDGFGNEWLVQTAEDPADDASFESVAGASLAIGDPVLGLRSLGRNAARDTAALDLPEDLDRTFVFEPTSVEATLHLRLYARDESTPTPTWQLLAPTAALSVASDWDGNTHQRLSHRRVLLVRPKLQDTAALPAASYHGFGIASDRADSTASATSFAQVVLAKDDDAAPLHAGPAKLIVYGYLKNDSGSGTTALNRLGSGVLDVVLQPGPNHLDVYLTDDLSTAPIP